MMIKMLFIILSLTLQKLSSCDFHDFDPYQYQLNHQQVKTKIETYLEKDPAIRTFYHLTPTALYIGDLSLNQIEYVLHLNTNLSTTLPIPIKIASSSSISQSMNNVKIALDPGHFGGAFAQLEERYTAIPQEQTTHQQAIYFSEGDLTYLTALELRRLLEAEGAVVLITRSERGKGAKEEDFFTWLAHKPDLKKSNDSLSTIFRNFYNPEDLRARAKKINDFNPAITIILHYNTHLDTQEKEQNLLVTKSNYNLAFIPGAFCADELKSSEARYEFLRLIVTDQLEKSLQLSICLTKQFVQQLHVPLISEKDKTSYLAHCLKQKPGIYSRNLVLNRLIHTPLCYGETLIQNNEQEVYKLSAQDAVIADRSCSKRIKEVAQAYFAGIKDYLKDSSL